MDLNREIIFAYLEEDNPRKAFFRAYPLLTVSGVVEQRFEDDGALRIIPDRNEQFVFKDRMRNIGIWCCIDLTPFPPSANKIRTNKNYSTARGERNQYIVFSDAIHDLSEAPFFEVLSGSPKDAGRLSSQAITPYFYIQEGDVLYGPVERRNPAIPEPSGPLSASLVTHLFPDGQTHTILCTQQVEPASDPAPEDDQAEAPAAPAEAADAPQAPEAAGESAPEELPLGESLTILDQQMTPDETIQSLVPTLPPKANLLNPAAGGGESSLLRESRRQQPQVKLNGTKLEGTRLHPVPTPVRDKVQETVHNKVRSANNAEPLVPPVPFSADLPEVENPVYQVMHQLQSLWSVAANRRQLIDTMVSLDGFQECLRRYYLGSGLADNSLVSITRRQIDALELERLQTLVALRQAKENLAAFRRQAIDNAAAREKAELTALREQVEQLRAIRKELAAEISRQQPDGSQAYQTGDTVRWNSLLEHLQELFASSGVNFVDEYARVWLALMADPHARLAVLCTNPEECRQGIESCAASLGWPCSLPEDTAGDAAPVPSVLHITTSLQEAEGHDGRTVVVLDDTAGTESSDLPMVVMNAAGIQALKSAAMIPIRVESVTKASEDPSLQLEEARIILAPLFQAAGLEDTQLAAAARFASTATSYLDGNIQSACDWALVLWLVPRVRSAQVREAMRDRLSAYPKASEMLG